MASTIPIVNSIVTLDAIKARCEVHGDCWLWTGAMIRNWPYMSVHVDGERFNRRVQKQVMELSGVAVPENAHITQRCGNPACCAPAHQKLKAAQIDVGFLHAIKGNPFGGLL